MSKTALDLINELIFELEAATVSRQLPSKITASVGATEPKAEGVTEVPLNVNSLDLRVGKIVKVWKHETAEKLYCEEIDVGEAEPRQIASGLVHHYSLEEMLGRRLIVVCNLKPRSLVGFKSSGMVLCAAQQSGGKEIVEFVDPPASAAIGERIVGCNLANEPLSQKQCDKRKAFEAIAPGLKVDSAGIAEWNGVRLQSAVSREPCSAPTLRDACIR